MGATMNLKSDGLTYRAAANRMSGASADTTRAGRQGLLGRSSARLLENAERVIFVVALVLFGLANLRAHQPLGLLVAANDGVTVFFLLFRRSTDQVSRSVSDWAVALFGTLGGMLMRPGGHAFVPGLVVGLLLLEGVAIQLAAKLSLNRRFGIAPANRGVQVRWAYRFVRHPMYLGYLLIHTAYLLLYPTWLNLAAWAVTWICQIVRIFAEERFLLTDPAYRDYAARVRYRLAPLLF
jgi:protein-S-isoprenylcysteine O-methyltransferase Ste14